MGIINVKIPDELDHQLRKKIAERYGGKKGNLQQAITEAISDWVKKKAGKEKS